MSAFFAMLILAYGPLDWAFPWWLWIIAFLFDGYSATINGKCDHERE